MRRFTTTANISKWFSWTSWRETVDEIMKTWTYCAICWWYHVFLVIKNDHSARFQAELRGEQVSISRVLGLWIKKEKNSGRDDRLAIRSRKRHADSAVRLSQISINHSQQVNVIDMWAERQKEEKEEELKGIQQVRVVRRDASRRRRRRSGWGFRCAKKSKMMRRNRVQNLEKQAKKRYTSPVWY